jgi:hypothetical protein
LSTEKKQKKNKKKSASEKSTCGPFPEEFLWVLAPIMTWRLCQQKKNKIRSLGKGLRIFAKSANARFFEAIAFLKGSQALFCASPPTYNNI